MRIILYWLFICLFCLSTRDNKVTDKHSDSLSHEISVEIIFVINKILIKILCFYSSLAEWHFLRAFSTSIFLKFEIRVKLHQINSFCSFKELSTPTDLNLILTGIISKWKYFECSPMVIVELLFEFICIYLYSHDLY